MLKKFGWADGQGLGKEGTGMREAIKVRKKDDNKGVGASLRMEPEGRWWEDAFQGVISKLQPEEESASDVSTADDFPSSSGRPQNQDGTRSSARADELRLAAELHSQPAWHGGGRFTGRAGKLARIRRQEAEAAAKLAGKLPVGEGQRQATAVATAAAAEAGVGAQLALGSAGQKQKGSKRKAPATAAVTPDAEADAAASKAAKRRRKAGKAGTQSAGDGSEARAATAAAAAPPKKARIVIEPAYQSLPGTHAAFKATPAAGWWGAKRFMSAGCLEGLSEQKDTAAKERQEFNEADQEALYNTTQNAKTEHKKGLGASALIGKVAGAKWTGAKITFDEDEAQPEAAGGRAAAQDTVSPKEENRSLPAAQLPASLQAVKWKKLVTAELQQAPGCEMKVKALQRKLMAGLKGRHGDLTVEVQGLLEADMFSKLSASSKFRLSSKKVALLS